MVEERVVDWMAEKPYHDKVRTTTFWPLPGGWENYMQNLMKILKKIHDMPRFDELADWAKEEFKTEADWTKRAIRIILVYTRLAEEVDGSLRLTERGQRLLESQDPRIVLDSLLENIWGVREILLWLGERPLSKEEIFKRCRDLGVNWEKQSQVGYRLMWLNALGYIERKGRDYTLTEKGKEVVDELLQRGMQPEPVKEVEVKLGVKEELKSVEVSEIHASHSEIVDMICEIGEMLNFHVRREEPTPDGVYRCDVTWRDYEGHISPIKVFEVELSGNVDHALSSLAHAYDTWRPEQLYLVVEDERDSERAKKLLEPRVRGAFARISSRLRIIGWLDLHTIYEGLKPKGELVKELSKKF